MSTSASTLTERTRRYLRDWPDQDTLTGSMSASVTTATVADGTLYSKNWTVQVEDEAMVVSANGAGTSVSVRRGRFGTTAVTHVSGSAILVRPAFTNMDILDALNRALDACFPLLYRPVATEWTGDTSTAYEYLIPNMTTLSVPIPYLARVEYKESGDTAFREVRRWSVVRGDTPIIKFRSTLPGGGTLRLVGFGPFAHLTASSDTLDGFFPYNAEDLLVEYAAQSLLTSGEAGRVRTDTGAVDTREQANRTGSSMAAANAVLARWQQRLRAAAMAPMPRHVVPVI